MPRHVGSVSIRFPPPNARTPWFSEPRNRMSLVFGEQKGTNTSSRSLPCPRQQGGSQGRQHHRAPSSRRDVWSRGAQGALQIACKRVLSPLPFLRRMIRVRLVTEITSQVTDGWMRLTQCLLFTYGTPYPRRAPRPSPLENRHGGGCARIRSGLQPHPIQGAEIITSWEYCRCIRLIPEFEVTELLTEGIELGSSL